MNINIYAIGRDKSSETVAMFSSYIKRIPWKVNIYEFEVKKNLPDVKRSEAESVLLLNNIAPNSYVIALDERGKALSSIEFASSIESVMSGSKNNIAFLIGGASGHSDEVRKRSDLLLSFGKMTWPHMMARVMLAEQLYRGYTILSGHPYHKK